MCSCAFVRVLAGTAAVVLAVAGLESHRLAFEMNSASPLLRAMWGFCALAAFASFGVAVAPRSLLLRIVLRMKGLRQNLALDAVAPNSRTLIIGFVSAIGLFVVSVLASRMDAVDPRLDDQGAYLQIARQIESGGGVFALFVNLRSGMFLEANRHPLYPALLSVRPDEMFGRALSLALATVAAIVSVVLVSRRFSMATAAVFALLLALNRSFAGYATSVVCESLMMLWGSVAYFALLPPKIVADAEVYRGPRIGETLFRILACAAFLGMMYLTKATGLLFFLVFLGWLVWAAAHRSKRAPAGNDEPQPLLDARGPEAAPLRVLAVLGASMVFLIVGQPLIERNIRAYGDPFFNINSLLLFADDYDDFDAMLGAQLTTGQAAKQYVASHSIRQMASREARGMAWEAFIIARSLGPGPLDDGRILFGFPLALAALLSLMTDRRAAASLLVTWVAVAWIVFAWYVPIAAGDRFFIPLLIPVLAHASDGIIMLAPRRMRGMAATSATAA